MKKLNIFVAVLVAIALILLIALMVKSLVTDSGGNVAVTTPPASTATATPPVTTPPASSVTPPEDTPAIAGESPTPAAPSIDGERFNIESPIAHEALSITIDTSAYTRHPQDMGDVFYLSSDPSQEVFLEIALVYGDLALKKPGFLDFYMPDYTHMEESGQVYVASSAVVGEGLSVTDDTRRVDGWLIEVEGGFFAVVTGYHTEEQGAALYRMLDTLTFAK
ncbi:MAG: hypothetical protein LBN99_06950 [Oscillospiraceae bacterium]|jgi:hypothetical protein|nr:hypothetical protein [Oscillospiraceae bacterium]